MQFRHEVKHEISHLDMLILRQRLKAVMTPDGHTIDGQYEIRSLYFDNLDDKVLREKMDGVITREKYRLRLYNHDPSVIHLERKFKHAGLGYKEQVALTPEQAQQIADGDIRWMAESTDKVIPRFYSHIRNEGLAARVIVDYTREPFVFGPGNVRVTLDYHIRTALCCTDFLDSNCTTIPVPGALSIVRFRTAIKDPLDIAFLFWSIGAGIVLAAGMIPLAIIGSVCIGVILLIFVNKSSNTHPYMVVLSCADHDAEVKATEFLSQNVTKTTVKSKSAVKGAIELSIETRLKDDNTDFVNILSEMPGINSTVIVSYNGEYMG